MDTNDTNIPKYALNVEAALQYRKMGLYPIPLCWPDNIDRCGCGRGHIDKRIGKAPLLGIGYQELRPTEKEIIIWWTKWPKANIGILVQPSGIAAIDCDSNDAFVEALDKGMPTTWSFSTGRGQNRIYRLPTGVTGSTTKQGHSKAIDIKASGYMVFPPSIHRNGKEYKGELSAVLRDLPLLPSWAIGFLKDGAKNKSYGTVTVNLPNELPFVDVESLPVPERIKLIIKHGPEVDPGHFKSRSEAMYAVQMAIIDAGCTNEVLASVLLDRTNGISEKPLEQGKDWTAGEIARVRAKHVPKSGYQQFFDKNEFLPKRLAEKMQQERRFICAPINDKGQGVRLYVYDDGVFKPNGESVARALANELLGDKWKEDRVEGAIKSLKETTKVSYSELNQRAMDLINVQNGMLDWRTGDLLEHDPEYLSTFQINASYQPNIQSSDVDRFLSEVFNPDALCLADEMIGYFMLPDVSLQVAFNLIGSGANGKSTFLDLVVAFIGEEYVSHEFLQELDRNRFRIAELEGKLLNVHHDLPLRTLEETGVIKSLITGNPTSAERKNMPPFKFKPFARLLFASNRSISTKDTSDGFFRRWILIEFPNKFEKGAADPHILKRLTTVEGRSAILNRAIVGLQRLKAQGGISEPDSVKNAKEEYRRKNDSIRDFILSKTRKEANAKIKKVDAYGAYKRWCGDQGIQIPERQSDFNAGIKSYYGIKDITDRHDLKGEKPRIWPGICLVGDEADTEVTLSESPRKAGEAGQSDFCLPEDQGPELSDNLSVDVGEKEVAEGRFTRFAGPKTKEIDQ